MIKVNKSLSGVLRTAEINSIKQNMVTTALTTKYTTLGFSSASSKTQ